MKILFTNFHEGYGGGHDTYLYLLCKTLSPKHEITVAAAATSSLLQNIETLPSVKIIPISFKIRLKKLFSAYNAVTQLRHLLKANSYDIIHVNGSADHTMAILATLFLPNPPSIVYTKHNSLPIKWGARLRCKYFTDHIIAVSHSVKKMYGFQNTPITVIQNGIDTDYFAPPNPLHALQLRKKWGIPENALVFGSVAGTALYKGWWLFLAAVAKIQTELARPIKIIIAGTPPSKEDIQEYVEKMGLQEIVIFPGLLPDVRECISIIDVGFVLSYHIETISFACREMMAMGKPVIVSDYQGLPENITPNKDGWITRTKDVESIKYCLLDVLKNTENLKHLSKQAREKALKDFTHTQFIKKTLSVYQKCMHHNMVRPEGVEPPTS